MMKKMHLLALLREDSSKLCCHYSAQRGMYARRSFLQANYIFLLQHFFMKVDLKPCKCVIVNINKQWLLPLFYFFQRRLTEKNYSSFTHESLLKIIKTLSRCYKKMRH
jgi:hypothetical protein